MILSQQLAGPPWCLEAGPDLGLVRPQATVIPTGAPTASHPNYINNFIKILLDAFRSIVILQTFNLFLY